MIKRNKVARIIEDMNRQLAPMNVSPAARTALSEFSLFKLADTGPFNANASKIKIKRELGYLQGLVSGAADPNETAQRKVTEKLNALKISIDTGNYEDALGKIQGMKQEEFLYGSWTATGEADLGDVIEDDNVEGFLEHLSAIEKEVALLAANQGAIETAIDPDALINRAIALYSKAFDWFNAASTAKKEQLKKLPAWVSFYAFYPEVSAKKVSSPLALSSAVDSFESAFSSLGQPV